MLRLTSPHALTAALLIGAAVPAPLAYSSSSLPSSGAAPLETSTATLSTRASAAAWDAYTDGADKARKQRLEGLVEFAKWAHKAKTYQQRDTAYELILTIDPDHKDARKFLKYSFDRKKEMWLRKRPYKTPKPGKPEVVAEGVVKLKALDDAFVGTMIELIDEHEEKLGPAKRSRELRAVLAMAPDQIDIREALGYVAVEKGGKITWTTEVAIATLEARDELAESLAKAQDETPDLEEAELKDFEEAIDVDWGSPLMTKRVRVVHNVEDEESEKITEIGHFMWSFLPDALGSKSKARKGFTIYVVDGESERAAVIESHPLLREREADSFQGVGAFWHGGGPAGFNWTNESITRIDSSCKQITSNYIWQSYQIDGKVGWVIEGVGQYINQMVLGTRLTYTLTRTEYEDKVKPRTNDRVKDADADWIAIAGEVLAEAKPTRLASTLGRNTNELNSEDLVLAYTLVAYLREGHGVDTFAEVLKRVGAGEASSVVILEDVLQAPLPEIQGMIEEWIAEVGGHDYDH